MNDTPSAVSDRFLLPRWIRGPQDFIGGLVLMAVAVFALWASSDLQGMHGFSFGAGTAPRIFAVLLLGIGVVLAGDRRVHRRRADGEVSLARAAVRQRWRSCASPSRSARSA